MTFSVDQYNQTVADYKSKWLATDVVLYDLCRRYPDHCDPGGVRAKLQIIGRTYATGIERKISSRGTQGGALEKLASYMLANAAKVTQLFDLLPDVSQPLKSDHLRTIIDVHGQFVGVLRELTRNAQCTRSFCSKYMHFHCPTVPIYDSYAAATLPRLIRWQRWYWLSDLSHDIDGDYAKYALRFWQLYKRISDAGLHPTVKYLDYYVLHVAEAPV